MGKGKQNGKESKAKETLIRMTNDELLEMCNAIWNTYEDYEAFKADNKCFQETAKLLFNSEFMKNQVSACFRKYGMRKKFQEPKDLLPLATFQVMQNLFKFQLNEYTLGSMATAIKHCLYDEMRDTFDSFPDWSDLADYAECFEFARRDGWNCYGLEIAGEFLQKISKYGNLKSDVVLDTPEQLLFRLQQMNSTLENSLYEIVCQWSTSKYQMHMEEMYLDDEENGLGNMLSDRSKDVETLVCQREQLHDVLGELQQETSSLRVLAFLLVKGGEMAPRHLAQLILEKPDYHVWAVAIINDRFSRYYGENYVWKTEKDYLDLHVSYALYTEEALSAKISHTLDKLIEKMRGHLVPKYKMAS